MALKQVIKLAVSISFFNSTAMAAIFGVDDREALTEKSQMYSYSRSVAVAILSSLYEPSGDKSIKIMTDHFRGYICPTERFAEDPSLSYACTGFLIAPDLIATAGHCMVSFGESRNETDKYCQAYSWLFDYNRPISGRLDVDHMPADSLYRCKQVVYAISEDVAPFRDFAIVQLDRSVTGRQPLTLALPEASVSDGLKMIGYPLGTPAKLSKGGKIIKNDRSLLQFRTNLDAFEGNSGSPVLNDKNQVVGILVSGEPIDSFVTNKVDKCEVYNRCDERGLMCSSQKVRSGAIENWFQSGSDVQRISTLIDKLNELGLR